MTAARASATRPDGMVELAAWVTGRGTWQRYALAAVLGAAGTLAFAPFFVVPLLIPAFTGLLWLLDGCRRPRAAFAVGWWFGFGHFAVGIYWVALALLVDADKFAWMVPFAVPGLAAGLAVFIAVATLVVWLLGRSGAARVVLFAVVWTAMEWLRAHALTGFPWNLVAYGWSWSPEVAQISALTGAYGLSLLTVLAAAAPAAAASTGAGGWRLTWIGAGLLALAAAGGAVRLAMVPETEVSDIRLRIVQPNIPQALKWRADRQTINFDVHRTLTLQPGLDDVSLIIWPETAVTSFLAREPTRRAQLAALVPDDGFLITGAPRVEPGANPSEQRFWNSLHVLDRAGTLRATYDKHHLVPFGEYVPFRSILGLSKITQGRTDFTPGGGPSTLAVAGLPPFSPLICYEAIFPGAVVEGASGRPAWLLNITNDAWFGISTGPHQHFASARFRTVEEGLPLVRAASTGISAVIDPYGRVVAKLPLGERGVLDAPLPAPGHATPFARLGDWIILVIMAVLFLAVLVWPRPAGRSGTIDSPRDTGD